MLGAGADDLLMLCARSYAGPGDRVAIADEPSYPLYRVAAWVTGADVGDDDPVLTFVCRPHNPTRRDGRDPGGAARSSSTRRTSSTGARRRCTLIGDDVIVVRTFSKAFGLASARVGYALADVEIAAELNERQQPAPISTLSAALALAGLEAGPPDVSATIAERERLADGLRRSGSSRCRRTRTSSSCRTSGRRSSTRRCSRRARRAAVAGRDPHHRAPAGRRRPARSRRSPPLSR